MLAYVFWHWPAEGISTDRYVAGLVGFHRALNAAPSPGLQGSQAFAVEGEPWPIGPEARGRLYEDWYFVDDFAALGALNEAAIAASRKEPHDAVAKLARGGAGGVYKSLVAAPSGEELSWFGKPPDMTYAQLLERMPKGMGLWQRQMVLGPAPEFRLAGPPPAGIAARTLRVRSLYRSGF